MRLLRRERHTCPKRSGDILSADHNGTNKDRWRWWDKKCSCCGSMRPLVALTLIEAGYRWKAVPDMLDRISIHSPEGKYRGYLVLGHCDDAQRLALGQVS